MTSHDDLRKLAEACPKPSDGPFTLGAWWDAGDLALMPVDVAADRAFIQAASPATVTALLDALRTAEGRAAAAEAATIGHRQRAERAEARLASVRDLHRPVGRFGYCGVCAYALYPCPTIRALDEEPQP